MAKEYSLYGKIGEIYGTILKKSATITPSSVAATSVVSQAFTVSGVKSGDVIIGVDLDDWGLLNGVGIAGAYVSDDDEVTILFVNPTGSAITPDETTYTFYVLRPAGSVTSE